MKVTLDAVQLYVLVLNQTRTEIASISSCKRVAYNVVSVVIKRDEEEKAERRTARKMKRFENELDFDARFSKDEITTFPKLDMLSDGKDNPDSIV